MKLALIALAICAGVAGCDKPMFDDSIQKAVREKLKDPESAKFEKGLIYQTRACISFNAKNSFGGYAGTTVAYLTLLSPNDWYVDTLDGEPCDEYHLKELVESAEIDNDQKKVEKEVLQKLKEKNLIPSTVDEILAIDDPKCQMFAENVRDAIGDLNQSLKDKEADNSSQISVEIKQSLKEKVEYKLAIINSGSCGE